MKHKVFTISSLFVILLLVSSSGGWQYASALDTSGQLGLVEKQGIEGQDRVMEATWAIEAVDAPKLFQSMGQRSLALDANGLGHIAYGGDHLYYAWYDGPSWHRETVDISSGVGSSTSLALDAADHPHIAYSDQANGTVKYAHYNGSTWQIETIDDGVPHQLILDDIGHPWVSYSSNYPDYDLSYAYYDGTTWQIEPMGVAAQSSSLALDALGRPHFSYCLYDTNNLECSELQYAYYDGATWQVETVDIGEGMGEETSLALDADSHPHIGYLDTYNEILKYAYHDGTSWQVETVAPAPGWGIDLSLALDGSNLPQISYFDDTDDELNYAHHDGTAWQIETVEGDLGFLSGDTSLALDVNDHPHISYYDSSTGNLRYASHNGSVWNLETVDSSRDTGLATSLAIDSVGQPHISYYSRNQAGFRYAVHDSGGWQIETVGDHVRTGWQDFTSLALDAMDRPHLAYGRYSLVYAHHDGTGWQFETVDVAGGAFACLILDEEDYPHISYYDDNSPIVDNPLKYAYYDGAVWHTEVVQSDLGFGSGYTSLALDSANQPHIAYYDNSNYDLKYAYYDGVTWQFHTVDSDGSAGISPSLALDAGGNPHISYFHSAFPNPPELRYAYHDGTTWHIEVVHVAQDFGVRHVLDHYTLYTSLALDPQGWPHIGYFDGSSLKYAYSEDSTWQIENVASNLAGSEAGYISMALDSSNLPHISYRDEPNGDLKYAYRQEADNRVYLPLVVR